MSQWRVVSPQMVVSQQMLMCGQTGVTEQSPMMAAGEEQ